MHCGAELGEGRFCTNCGTPVGSATAPVAPPVIYGPPTTYQLPSGPPAAEPAAPRRTPAHAGEHGPHWTGWVLLVIGLAIAIALGSCLARQPDEAGAKAAPAASTTGAPTTGATARPTPLETGRPGVDLALTAEVEAPNPIRPGKDVAGNQVPYPATNMLDDRRDSAYRLAGDATGTVIRFVFDGEKTVSAVGLVNGYAKVDGRTDWYPLNRRIEAVEWKFEDGTTIQQDFVDDHELQAMQVSPETTRWVELRLVKVGKPPRHRGKDTTAISDVLLLGS